MQELLAAVQAGIVAFGINSLFLQVIVLGIIATLPIGPWSLVALDQTTKFGKKHGLIIASCAILGDMLMIAATLFCFKFIQPWIVDNQSEINIFISIMMIAFGVNFLLQKPGKKDSFKKEIIHFFYWFKVEKPLTEKFYNRLSKSHKFTYLFTIFWSGLHPGNAVTYTAICLIILSFGHDVTQLSTSVEYLTAFFIATAFMWWGWILFGQLKIIKKAVFYIIKFFGFLFTTIGILFLSYNIF